MANITLSLQKQKDYCVVKTYTRTPSVTSDLDYSMVHIFNQMHWANYRDQLDPMVMKWQAIMQMTRGREGALDN